MLRPSDGHPQRAVANPRPTEPCLSGAWSVSGIRTPCCWRVSRTVPSPDPRPLASHRLSTQGLLGARHRRQGDSSASLIPSLAPAAGRAAQAVAARDDDVPRAAKTGCERGLSCANCRQRKTLVAQQPHGAEHADAPRLLRPPGSPEILLTSTSRTARCGPACRVVWQGAAIIVAPLCRYSSPCMLKECT